MPRAFRVNKLMPLALSPSQAADAFGVRPEEIRELVTLATIPLFQVKNRRRLLVADLIEAIRKHWPQVGRNKS